MVYWVGLKTGHFTSTFDCLIKTPPLIKPPPLNKGNFDFLKKKLIKPPPSIRDFLRFYHDLIYTFQHFLYTSYAFFNVISSHKYHFFPGGSAPRPPKSFLAGILYNIPGKNLIYALKHKYTSSRDQEIHSMCLLHNVHYISIHMIKRRLKNF